MKLVTDVRPVTSGAVLAILCALIHSPQAADNQPQPRYATTSGTNARPAAKDSCACTGVLDLVGPVDVTLVRETESWAELAPDSEAGLRVRTRFAHVLHAMEGMSPNKLKTPREPKGAAHGSAQSPLPDGQASRRLRTAVRVAWLEARARFRQGDHASAIRLIASALRLNRCVAAHFGVFTLAACARAHGEASELIAQFVPHLTEEQLCLVQTMMRRLPPPPNPFDALRYEATVGVARPQQLQDVFSELLHDLRRYGLVRAQSVERTLALLGFDQVPRGALASVQLRWVRRLEATLRDHPPTKWYELENELAAQELSTWKEELLPFFPELREPRWLRQHIEELYPADCLLRRICRRVDQQPQLATKRRRRPLALLVAQLNPLLAAEPVGMLLTGIEGSPLLILGAIEHVRGERPESLTELRRLGLTARIVLEHNGFKIRTEPMPLELRVILKQQEMPRE